MWQDILEIWDKALPFMKNFGLIALKIIILLVVGYYLSRFVAKKIRNALESKDKMLANFLAQVVFIGTNIAVIIAALGTAGVQTHSIIAVLGTAGVAIALGLKDSLSSVASGIVLIILRPFVHGDTIEVGSLLGKVEAINLFNTTIRLPDGKLAILPNSNVSQANVINHTDISLRRIDLVFGVGYGSDINAVKIIAINVLEHQPCVDLARGYFVGVQDMGASSLDFLLRFWVNIDYGIIEAKACILEALKVNLEANGIEIPFNKLDVNVFQSHDTATQSSLDTLVYIDSKDSHLSTNTKHSKQETKSKDRTILAAFADKIKHNLKDNGA
ncbi:MAG TPA: mechanosensitive ion channel [Candidatus Helicobacter avicola]|nr:mechanosensitive ion channel [Candidatus Helicobacter avicola]